MNSKKILNFDVIVPCHEKDKDLIELCVNSCRKNISGTGTIYIITQSKNFKIDGCTILEEDNFFKNGLNKFYIEEKLSQYCPAMKKRAGWFFQQFIKMGCHENIDNLTDNYLALDSDVVFLKRISFFENGKVYLTKGEENHQPYLNLYEKLFGKTADKKISFVAHHMMMNKQIMKEIIKLTESASNKRWYDIILENVDSSNYMLSEYELYGHYLINKHPEIFLTRKLCNIQSFKLLSLVKMYFGFADYATFHNYKKPQFNPKTNKYIYDMVFMHAKSKLSKPDSPMI